MNCPKCNGTGILPDYSLMRKRRKEVGLDLKTVSSRMGISTVYLSHLERGLRVVNSRLIEKFMKAIKVR